MNLTIELPDDVGAALETQAEAQGVSAAQYASLVIEKTLAPAIAQQSSGQPFETGREMFAKYGPAPSAEEIDANRAEIFRNFAQDF